MPYFVQQVESSPLIQSSACTHDAIPTKKSLVTLSENEHILRSNTPTKFAAKSGNNQSVLPNKSLIALPEDNQMSKSDTLINSTVKSANRKSAIKEKTKSKKFYVKILKKSMNSVNIFITQII